MSLEGKIEDIKANVERLREMGQIHMPKNLAEAYSGEWELLADDALGMVGTAYLKVVRTKDVQRVIGIKAMVAILADYEEEMVEKMVIKGSDLVWKRASRYYYFAKWIIEHPDEVWQAIKDIVNQIQAADDVVEFVVAYAIELVAIGQIKKTLRIAMEVRNTFEAKMRARAFPQSTGKRIWRKAVTTK